MAEPYATGAELLGIPGSQVCPFMLKELAVLATRRAAAAAAAAALCLLAAAAKGLSRAGGGSCLCGAQCTAGRVKLKA